jgi:hypothetical protein
MRIEKIIEMLENAASENPDNNLCYVLRKAANELKIQLNHLEQYGSAEQVKIRVSGADIYRAVKQYLVNSEYDIEDKISKMVRQILDKKVEDHLKVMTEWSHRLRNKLEDVVFEQMKKDVLPKVVSKLEANVEKILLAHQKEILAKLGVKNE